MLYVRLFLEFFKAGLFAVGGGLATLPFLYAISDATGWFSHAQLADMVARNGRFFFLNAEERKRESEGLLEGREFGSPIYSADMQAWAARESGDARMARNIWCMGSPRFSRRWAVMTTRRLSAAQSSWG